MPKVLFCYKDENVWENIGRTIGGEISINNDYESKKDSGDIDGEIEFLIVPFFEFDSEKNEITSSGLEIVKRLRLAGKYNFRAIFLVTSEFNIPDIFNPHKGGYPLVSRNGMLAVCKKKFAIRYLASITRAH